MSETFDRALAAVRTVKNGVKARITETCRHVIDSASLHFSAARKLCVMPWSIQRIVRRDVADWRSANQYLRNHTLSQWARLLMHAGEHPVWFCLSLPIVFCVALLVAHEFPNDWIPGGWAKWGTSEQLGYFSTLWSIQATIAALAYPIVIAFVAVFLQRRPASDSVMHLYMLNSGALAAGLSSLILVVVMGVQYAAMPYFGASILLQCGALDALWFVVNAALTAHFLYRTVEFLRPDVQLDVVRRYVASVAFPRDINRLYPFQVFAQAHSKGWIPAPDYLDDKNIDGPKVLLTRYGFGRGAPQGTLDLSVPSRLVNVRLWPLSLVIAAWANSAARWPRPPEQRGYRRPAWPLLSIPITPGTEYHESVHLAQIEAGPDLTTLQRWLLRRAFVLTALKRERYQVRVKSIIDEFELDARTAAQKPDAKDFERAYNALVGLHELLLGVSQVINEDGSAGSWALLPDFDEFFDTRMHALWNDAYRSVFLAAIESMTIDSNPLRRLCHIAQHLGGKELQASPVEIHEAILDLPMLLMYQLGGWWARHIEEQGVQEHSAHRGSTLAPPLFRLYEDVVATFISGWENARTHIAEIPEASDTFEWRTAAAIARIQATHVQGTAKLLIAAVARGDKTAAEWFADSLSKWWGDRFYDHRAMSLYDKTEFFTVDVLTDDWPLVEASLGLAEHDEQFMGERRTDVQRGVLLASLLNLWTDIRLVTLELLLSFACQQAASSLDDSLAMEISAGLLTGKQWRSGATASESLRDMGAPDYFAAKVRQFASDGRYRGRYVGRLSLFVERVKDAQQANMISSRTYSSTGVDGLESLQEQLLILIAALSTTQWAPGPSLRRQLDGWMTTQYASIDLVRSRLKAWLDRLNDPVELCPQVLERLLTLTGKTIDTSAARTNLKASLESTLKSLEEKRSEALRNEPVDEQRLAEISSFASRTAFDVGSGAFPLQLFSTVRYTANALQDFTLNMLQVKKGELTRNEMDQRAINEAEYWDETMRDRVGALVLSDTLRGCNMKDHAVPDADFYWSTLRSESKRMMARGLHPILLLENPTKPNWAWQWQHADFGLGYHKPDDLRVWHANDKGRRYVCNFNEVEVYSAILPPGQSILLAREAFRAVDFQKFGDHACVETTYTARDDNNTLVDLHLKFSRRVDVGHNEAIRLLYAVDANA